MTVASYDDLVTAVGNYLARDDLAARVPEFIALAEAKFNRQLHCRQMEFRSTTSIDMNSTEPQMVSLPSYFQAMRSLKVTNVAGKPRLQYMSDTQLDEYRQRISDQAGMPLYFSVFGSEMELCPTPDSAYTLEMKYRAVLPALASGNQTNWLLALAPDAYLYGVLLEAAPYMKEDPRISTWGAGLSAAITALNDMSMESKYGSGPLVMRTSDVTP